MYTRLGLAEDKPTEPIGLGDVVSFGWEESDYNQGTVCQIHTNGYVDVFRIYVHHADFSYAGRREGSSAVICYIGTEEVKDVDPKKLKLIRKSNPLR